MSNPKYIQSPLPFPEEVFEIPLTQGKVALVSAEDTDLMTFNWFAHYSKKAYYAYRMSTRKVGKRQIIKMHRIILERILGRTLEPNEYPDHKNGNGLDNQRSNLRLATAAQNSQNMGKPITNTSGYKGVCWSRRAGKWLVQIRVNGKRLYLGYYHTPEEGYQVYCEAAEKYHGEFARLK